MPKRTLPAAASIVCSLCCLLAAAGATHAAPLELKSGDHICLVGNGLAERLQHFNHWESLLHIRHRQHRLVVRNLAFGGDEVVQRMRSENFGTPDEHLTHSKADVILFFFGLNESFAGRAGLEKFNSDLEQLVRRTLTKRYNGRSAPRIVLVSPIAAENLGDENLPDGKSINDNLRLYVAATAAVAKKTGVGFADVFAPTLELFADPQSTYTFNGIHMNQQGHERFASILDTALFGDSQPAGPFNEQLRAEIKDKNFHWRHRYRPLDGYYIHGKRSLLTFADGDQSNRDVCQREREVLDQMTANRDRRIWALAQGESVAPVVDDSNTKPFLTVKSNFGLPNRFKNENKVGTLKYNTPQRMIDEHFSLAAGYKVNCFASEIDFPELQNPVQMAFDARGRLWVVCMPSYPHYKPKDKLDDKLLILEDTDDDGAADKCIIFVGGLHVPAGFELGDGGAYIGQMPYIIHYQDTDGDDVADRLTRVVSGLDSADTHHQSSSFTWGPGGSLYFQEGVFHRTQVETPYGPVHCADGGVYRFDPRRKHFDVFASYRFPNPWGHSINRWGQNFINDGTGGKNYVGAAFSGHVDHPRKHGRLKEWIVKRFRPVTSSEFVSSRQWPDEAQGAFLLANVIGDHGIFQHKVMTDRSGYVGKEIEPILRSSDHNFRPTDLKFGPDGALYVSDWQNALIGHMQHSVRDPSRDHTHGRVWRIVYEGRPLLESPKIAGASIEELLESLKIYEDRVRYRARRELRLHPTEKIVPAVKIWVADLDRRDVDFEHQRLEALWLLQQHNAVDLNLLREVLQSPQPLARAAAVRVLCYSRHVAPDALDMLKPLISDDSAQVRLEAVRACSFFPSLETTDLVVEVLAHPMDDYLQYALNETLATLDAATK